MPFTSASWRKVITPTVAGMAAEGNDYTGFLYAGLMIDKSGAPKVIEYNCRFGDPETQPIMMQAELRPRRPVPGGAGWCTRWRQCRLGRALRYRRCPGGGWLPGQLRQGCGDSRTRCRAARHGQSLPRRYCVCDGENIVTSGGRVLCVTALGADIREAQTALLRRRRQDQLGRRDPAPRYWLAGYRAL